VNKKIAIIHPSFAPMGGGERVVDVLAEMYPNADFFTLYSYKGEPPSHVRGKKVTVSKLDRLIRLVRGRAAYLTALYPWAIEQLDLRGYDLVISSCGPGVMGVNIDQGARHIAYIHTPQRAWWDQYAEFQATKRGLVREAYVLSTSYMRIWEFNAMQRVDCVVSNSNYIADRVWRYFRRKGTVVYPPVNTSMGFLADHHEDYFLTVSRLEENKRIDLIIQACNQMQLPLVIVGVGSEYEKLKPLAGQTIQFRGRVSDEELTSLYARCRAFLFAADEDFGIAPLEAQSFGRPVIAYGHGGSLETVSVDADDGKIESGVFFSHQTVESVMEGIRSFQEREHLFIPAEIQKRAKTFDTEIFKQRFQAVVEECFQQKPEWKAASLLQQTDRPIVSPSQTGVTVRAKGEQ